MRNVNDWLEKYIKQNGPVTPAKVYEAGKSEGITKREIKDARRWHGKYINTQTKGDRTLWRWDP